MMLNICMTQTYKKQLPMGLTHRSLVKNVGKGTKLFRGNNTSRKMLKLAILLICFSVFFTIVSVSGSGSPRNLIRYESYLCDLHRNFSSGLLSCNEDCQLSHGAVGGACLDPMGINRYNCKCGPRSGLLPKREQQCIEPSEGYRNLCHIDCLCNHGAHTGYCDYSLKSCFCEGENPKNEGCPAYSFQHFLLLAKVGFEIKHGKRSGPSWLHDGSHG